MAALLQSLAKQPERGCLRFLAETYTDSLRNNFEPLFLCDSQSRDIFASLPFSTNLLNTEAAQSESIQRSLRDQDARLPFRDAHMHRPAILAVDGDLTFIQG